MRTAFQAVWTLVTNSYLKGFIQGGIYRGAIKSICVPGLNCYSCPGALGACPIGALQAVGGSRQFSAPFYALGFIIAYGAFFGRGVCGWLCPFGLVQDLLHKIPFPKKKKHAAGNAKGGLRYLKYAVLAVFVFALPLLVTDVVGQGDPWFCKYICPSGTLFAGWPLTLANPSLRAATGLLFTWKNIVLLAVIIGSVLLYRPFCKYLCPLGAIYALCNKVSLWQMELNDSKCTKCGVCNKACKMGVNPAESPNHAECIRCGDCISACPHNALHNKKLKKQKKVEN